MHVPADCDCSRILRQHGTQDDRVYQYMYVKEHRLYMTDVPSYMRSVLQGIKEKQLDLAIGAKLQDKLASAGAINIEARKSYLPLNHSGEPGIRTW